MLLLTAKSIRDVEVFLGGFIFQSFDGSCIELPSPSSAEDLVCRTRSEVGGEREEVRNAQMV